MHVWVIALKRCYTTLCNTNLCKEKINENSSFTIPQVRTLFPLVSILSCVPEAEFSWQPSTVYLNDKNTKVFQDFCSISNFEQTRPWSKWTAAGRITYKSEKWLPTSMLSRLKDEVSKTDHQNQKVQLKNKSIIYCWSRSLLCLRHFCCAWDTLGPPEILLFHPRSSSFGWDTFLCPVTCTVHSTPDSNVTAFQSLCL